MTDNLPPLIVGAAGLTGRPLTNRPAEELEVPAGYDEQGEPIWDTPRAVGKAIPPNCLRVLHSPLPKDRGGGCTLDCPGLQRDGSCLCDIVRAAEAQGVDWEFEVDPRDNRWLYIGPEIELPEPEEDKPPTRFIAWTCPHCLHENTHDLANFHYWCEGCGKNANDAA